MPDKPELVGDEIFVIGENLTRVNLENLCDFSRAYSAHRVPCFICRTDIFALFVSEHSEGEREFLALVAKSN
jgi:hypothetical protein